MGRWFGVDPLAEKYYSHSPYAFCGNNPIKFIDIDGKEPKDKMRVSVSLMGTVGLQAGVDFKLGGLGLSLQSKWCNTENRTTVSTLYNQEDGMELTGSNTSTDIYYSVSAEISPFIGIESSETKKTEDHSVFKIETETLTTGFLEKSTTKDTDGKVIKRESTVIPLIKVELNFLLIGFGFEIKIDELVK